MLRWCSFCQTFLGESIPYDDFGWTDGICSTCKKDGKYKGATNAYGFAEKLNFFRTLRNKAIQGQILEPMEILNQANGLGIRPSDVLIGILQPVLCEIGNLFALGKISTIEEHRFSALTEKILDHFENQMTSHQKASASNAQVVLASADQNYHTIGLRMLSIILQLEGFSVACVTPSVPAKDLARLCKEVRPNVLGISLFAEKQIHYVKEVIELLGSARPKLISVGGYLVKKKNLQLDASIYIASTRTLSEVVARFKKACESETQSPAA